MKKKTLKHMLLAVMGALIIVEIIVRMIMIKTNTFAGIMQLISLVFSALYVFLFYKKPHGNMLKYAMLVFSFANILSSSYLLMTGNTYQVVKLLAAAAVCYCAGRLNRIDENKYMLPALGLFFFWVSVSGVRADIENQAANVFTILTRFNNTVNYFTLVIAYFVRYDEHKEAGLADAPRK